METPLTTLMLERCAQTLEKVIMPDLTDTFAIDQATHMSLLMHTLALTVEEKSQGLREENGQMMEALGEVLRMLREEKALSQNATSNALISRLDGELKKIDAGPPDANEDNYNLKASLVETIKGLDALGEDLPEETSSSLRQQIRSVLRQQLDHAAAQREILMAAQFAFMMALLQPKSASETPDQ